MNNIHIHRVLIPVDFSPAGDCAVQHGAYLASLFNADVFILHVLENASRYPNEWFKHEDHNIAMGLIRKKTNERLGVYSGKIEKEYGITVHKIVSNGKPANKIAETVAEHDIDLVVMGTHGASGFEEIFVGSNAHKAVTLAPCPVITIREGYKPNGIKSIVFPIDSALHSRQKIRNVLPIAIKANATVYILGLVKSNNQDGINKINMKLDTVEAMIKEAGLNCVRKVSVTENVAMEAINYTAEVNADMLAVMSDHESDLTNTFMGAFAQHMINHSKVPVMSIRPYKSTYDYPV